MEKLNIWFDEEGDFLEIRIGKKKGFFRDIGDDVWERVDENGNVTGIAILNFRKRSKKELELPFELKITPVRVKD